MQTEPISKITNEKKDKALVSDFLQYINPWCHINSWSSYVTKANTKSGKWFSRGTEYVGFVVSLYFVTISKQWCFKFLVLHIGISKYTELASLTWVAVVC